ncbi:MaoC family dehydratase [Modestobacter excelsi]|uniref:MaoC family dehydratase n=1 Tax=Modestobacter excelsi TaxID=2213161 RepID=UPI001C20D3AD|nr:MaoC/PaaZ C-terminal domain-containing protein [Modestobacter excelsi]
MPLQPGEVLTRVRGPVITREVIAEFAQASGDHNPIHLDRDAAVAAGHDDVIVHGMYVMALVGNHLRRVVDPSLIRAFTVRFAAVTSVNSSLDVTITVADRSVGEPEDVVELAVDATRDDGTRVVVGTARVAVPVGDGRSANETALRGAR